MTTGQFRRECEELLNRELFKVYHPVGYSHIMDRHVNVSSKDLWMRLRPIPFTWEELNIMSRFFEGTFTENIFQMIHETLLCNEKEVLGHLKTKAVAEVFVMDFEKPIGEALVKGADRNNLIPMSRLRISIGRSDTDGRLFEVISAYPVPNMDEIDMCWDAIEEWQEKLARKNREG